MSKGFKVPPHLSVQFNAQDAEGKKNFILRYNNWLEHDFTKALKEGTEGKIEALTIEQENKNDFISFFQSKYYTASTNAKKQMLRYFLKLIS